MRSGGCRPAEWQQPLRLAAAVAVAAFKSYLSLPCLGIQDCLDLSFPYPNDPKFSLLRCRRVAGLRLLAFVQRGTGRSPPSPGTPRSVGTRRAASMQDRCPEEPHAQRSWHLQRSPPAQSEDLPPEEWLAESLSDDERSSNAAQSRVLLKVKRNSNVARRVASRRAASRRRESGEKTKICKKR